MTSSTLTLATAAGTKPRSRGWRRYPTRTFYAFVSPWILGFVLLTLAPVLYALIVSFTNYDGASSLWRFVGARNYIEIFTSSPQVWLSLLRTLGYTAIVVPLSVAGGLFLAILVNRRIRARGVVRAIFFVPSVVPVVATAIMWRLIFNRDAGLLNGILSFFGIGPTTWLSDPYAFYALIVMTLWGLGGGMVISLAALQDVPVELEEAARLDGAGTLRIIRNVTIPLISPVLYFQVITGIIASLQMLVQPLLLAETNRVSSSALVPQSSTLYMVQVYNEFFFNHRFGFGSAMLWIFFIVILAITLILQRLSRRFVFYQVDNNQ
ncbi:carbohydrate ABC transporter permease [Lacisediminihabitans changchengi]|uniref:Sugar ABC transporter permease n=1 Tax=Lacisediminihabitans changchengi TaxID=2787634 RepID=A0A934W5L3_9MICO|nr:sugar ABC transporter permease [Lacisediminihabitans changchengi]MBK4348645.1 sugar ABC transporter permease [Lacisediminihabitans changchengi]